MTIQEIIEQRGITEVLHFTTNRGITGMCASHSVKSRKSLPSDKYLEHIVDYNCPDRSRDAEWHDYINLSITSINLHLFGISKDNWHSDNENCWCVLSFLPEILTHPRVYFTTTNNMYSGVKRHEGSDGLERLFAANITRWSGNAINRPITYPKGQPTCAQAEALYPNPLSLDYLQSVYVDRSIDAAIISSILDVYDLNVEILERPELFS